MSFQIDQGLAHYDCVDHYAILGLPITTEAGEIRKRYLRIARNLHPDSRSDRDSENQALANQLLSKLVNPSYHILTQERERAEYQVMLRLLGQRLVQDRSSLPLQSKVATQLLQTPGIPDHSYQKAVQDLAQQQYQVLEQALELIGQLSELNLVYLLRRQENGGTGAIPIPARGSAPVPGSEPGPGTSLPPEANASQPGGVTNSYVSQYYRRAEVLVAKNNPQAAIVELRDALKLDPESSECHSLLGAVYLKLNQLTMARIHFSQALKFNSRNAAALNGKQQVQRLERQAQGSHRGSSKPRGGGLFGLFGGKNKRS